MTGDFIRNDNLGTLGSGNLLPSEASVTSQGVIFVQVVSSTGATQTVIPISEARSFNGSAAVDIGAYTVATDSAETGSADNVIVATSHVAKTGDIILMTSGATSGQWVTVSGTDTNSINLYPNLTTAPSNGDTFSIKRPLPLNVDSSGNIGAYIVSGTTGGQSTYAALGGTGNALLTNSSIGVKTSAGELRGISFYNGGGADAYVQFFDLLTGSITLGTTVPKFSKWVPAGGSWDEEYGDDGIAFSTGISVAATTTATGNSAPGTGISAVINYK